MHKHRSYYEDFGDSYLATGPSYEKAGNKIIFNTKKNPRECKAITIKNGKKFDTPIDLTFPRSEIERQNST